ncbi:DUF262 domain-containing protein [Clavibacter sp. VKM Ac-2873]|uniref:DUF262 domain-containing protein n=1 Tax=Clavibacter sp. VKM Ac-2873 TaxID=2783813 RepID=UPI00188CCACE|nr:DUF262 domain-containing protein [Clavibacter sp. VKM Ac-2873]MBF4617868.1 DUF262 domain-containing protein [Clavibacter sp. VKM Ac-2873]
MKVESWDPDLRSLYARYREGSLDLQPSFQRGLVWNREKKARLLDTLIRGWRIPPVHFLVGEDESLAILDGQQRLQSIFDFLDGDWPLKAFPPTDEATQALAGKSFGQLSSQQQRRLLDSRISGYRLSDYSPDEPYELFFRLNLPTGLTQAEKRNALAGRTRDQVRHLVVFGEGYGWSRELFGFGDGRMAYDDVIARTCVYVHQNTLRTDLSPRNMEDFYRDSKGFDDDVIAVVGSAMEAITHALKRMPQRMRLNKATLLTWLLVASRVVRTPASGINLGQPLYLLEAGRAVLGRRDVDEAYASLAPDATTAPLIALYANRASLRVTDVLSVQARDAVAWMAIADFNSGVHLPSTVKPLVQYLGQKVHRGREGFADAVLEALVDHPEWSKLR